MCKETEILMAALNNVIADKDTFTIFVTVDMNKGEVTSHARVQSINCVRSETQQLAFAEGKQNHETALKFYAPLSVL